MVTKRWTCWRLYSIRFVRPSNARISSGMFTAAVASSVTSIVVAIVTTLPIAVLLPISSRRRILFRTKKIMLIIEINATFMRVTFHTQSTLQAFPIATTYHVRYSNTFFRFLCLSSPSSLQIVAPFQVLAAVLPCHIDSCHKVYQILCDPRPS